MESTASIAVGILSRLRPTNCRRCITSVVATIGCDHTIYVALDDDHISKQSLPHYRHCRYHVLQPRHYYVRGVNALFQWMKDSYQDLDYFLIINDDTEFLLLDWGPRILETFDKAYPDGMGLMELSGEGGCTNFITRREFIDSQFNGYIGNPVYTMYFSDSELLNRLKELGCYTRAYIEGNYPVADHAAEKDYTRLEVRDWYERDKKVYEERRKLL